MRCARLCVHICCMKVVPLLHSQQQCEQCQRTICCDCICLPDRAPGHADYNAYWYEEAMQTLYNATLTNLEPPEGYSECLSHRRPMQNWLQHAAAAWAALSAFEYMQLSTKVPSLPGCRASCSM